MQLLAFSSALLKTTIKSSDAVELGASKMMTTSSNWQYAALTAARTSSDESVHLARSMQQLGDTAKSDSAELKTHTGTPLRRSAATIPPLTSREETPTHPLRKESFGWLQDLEAISSLATAASENCDEVEL